MPTQRQIEANRQNAQNSTGPKSPKGKAVVALNAMKHGLLSEVTLIEGETEKDLVGFGQRLRTQLAPVGELEILLVDRVISNAWRLRRVVRMEGAFIEEGGRDFHAFSHFGHEKKMTAFSRYETTLERGLYKALHELQRLQAARDGATVPPPVAADVEVTISGTD